MTTTPAQSKKTAAGMLVQSDTSRLDAALLIAAINVDDDAEKLTKQQIAERIGVSRNTLYRWEQSPDFQAMVRDAEGQIKARALRVPSANVHTRVNNIHKLVAKILDGIDLRAETYQQAAHTPEEAARDVLGNGIPPWAANGLYIERKKIAPNGKFVTEWELDKAAIDAVDKLYQHIAKQLGQVDETINVNHSGSVYHDERLDTLTIEQMEAIERIRDAH